MMQKIQTTGSFLIILILLPCVVTIFVNGKGEGKLHSEEMLQVVDQSDEEKNRIITMEYDEYLTVILAKEMPVSYQKEALKAQAVLIRTELERKRKESVSSPFSYSYMTRREMEDQWKGAEWKNNLEKYQNAVKETKDKIVTYKGEPAWVPFHRASTGKTRDAGETLGSKDYPYLTSRECPEDKQAEQSLHRYFFTYREIQERCRGFLVAEGKEKARDGFVFSDFQITRRDAGDYVTELKIGNTICTGDQFRDALGLASSSFHFAEAENGLKITTVGIGHGLGLSQWTANELAKEGKTYEEILLWFYQGKEIEIHE